MNKRKADGLVVGAVVGGGLVSNNNRNGAKTSNTLLGPPEPSGGPKAVPLEGIPLQGVSRVYPQITPAPLLVQTVVMPPTTDMDGALTATFNIVTGLNEIIR
jgi:hypothetical protein